MDELSKARVFWAWGIEPREHFVGMHTVTVRACMQVIVGTTKNKGKK